MGPNTLHEKAVADHKVDEYKNMFQDYWRSSKPDLTICASKNHALHYLQILSTLYVIGDDCPVRQPFVTNLSSVKVKLTEISKKFQPMPPYSLYS